MIIALSGKKQSGKNLSGNFIAGKFLKQNGNILDFKIENDGSLSYWGHNKNNIKEGQFNKIFSKFGVKFYSFADPLKEFCIDVFGLTYAQCHGTDKEKNSITDMQWKNTPGYEDGAICMSRYKDRDEYLTAREVLQFFGTEIVRDMCPNGWVNATINKIKKENPKLAIITDSRFPNEIDGVNAVGGKTIRLLRSVNEDDHESEHALDNYLLDKYSYVIDNTQMTVQEQCNYFDKIYDELLK